MGLVEDNTERYSRQRDIVPADRIDKTKATVIGVGAIGRQVALQLAAMGVPWLQLVDFDTVEISNLASQGYLEEDLGKTKVAATAALARQANKSIIVIESDQRFRRSLEVGNNLFCCVDSIEIRRIIWEALKDRISFFIDGRMTAEIVRIITVTNRKSREYYPSTLFSQAEAYSGPCTARTTIYCSNIAAGFMITQFAKYLRNLNIDCDFQLNLLAGELSVTQTV